MASRLLPALALAPLVLAAGLIRWSVPALRFSEIRRFKLAVCLGCLAFLAAAGLQVTWLLGAGLLALAAAAPVTAHSLLLESAPAAGATLTAAPRQLTLRFNNRIEKSLSRVRLLDARGEARHLVVAADAVDSMDGEDMHRFALRLVSAALGWPLTNAEILAALTS